MARCELREGRGETVADVRPLRSRRGIGIESGTKSNLWRSAAGSEGTQKEERETGRKRAYGREGEVTE